jgi:hypothetical protein
MKRTACVLALLLLSACHTPEERGLALVQERLRSARSIEVLELSPWHLEPPAEPAPQRYGPPFYSWEVLGRAPAEPSVLIPALLAEVKPKRHSGIVLCFNPRRGIRAISPGGTLDLVLSYECFQIEAYWNGARITGQFVPSGTARALIDAALTKHAAEHLIAADSSSVAALLPLRR